MALRMFDDPSRGVLKFRDSVDSFLAAYRDPADLESLVRDECRLKKIPFNRAEYRRDLSYIRLALKARVARQLFGTEGQLRVLIREGDPAMRAASRLVSVNPS